MGGLAEGLRDDFGGRYLLERELGRGRTPGRLRADPAFDTPRTLPRFQKPLEGTA